MYPSPLKGIKGYWRNGRSAQEAENAWEEPSTSHWPENKEALKGDWEKDHVVPRATGKGSKGQRSLTSTTWAWQRTTINGRTLDVWKLLVSSVRCTTLPTSCALKIFIIFIIFINFIIWGVRSTLNFKMILKRERVGRRKNLKQFTVTTADHQGTHTSC